MNFVFYSLADAILKRICKFLLKKTIAKYFEDDELLLSRLQLTSHDGKALLSDIRFKQDVINDEFLGSTSPLQIESASISELEVNMSCSEIWNKMMINGGVVHFNVHGLDIVLKSNEMMCESDACERIEGSFIMVTGDATSINTIGTMSGIQVHSTRTDSDEHTPDQHHPINSCINDWIKSLQYQLAINCSIHSVSIKILMNHATSVNNKRVHHYWWFGLDDKTFIIQFLLVIVILSLWLPIFYYK